MKLDKLITETVKSTLMEMGTIKQNQFLKSLMGNNYDPKYDNYSVSDTSKLIQQELDKRKLRQQNANPNSATSKQLDFIENNSYFPIPTIRQIEGQLTKDDATILVNALNPYTNGSYTYYGHVRQRKEEWLPEMKNAVVPVLDKYGLTQESQRITTYVDNFIAKHKAKIEREQKKKEQQRMEDIKKAPNTIFFISTQDDDNISQHQTERLTRDMWMDGILSDKMGWDIAYIATDLTNYSLKTIQDFVYNMNKAVFPAIVLGYDKPCSAVLWLGIDIMGQTTICGRIVDQQENSIAYQLAKKLLYKQDDGSTINNGQIK